FSLPFFEELRQQRELWASITAFTSAPGLLASGLGAPAAVSGELVSGSYFPTLGVGAPLGRTLIADDDQVGAPPAVGLSHRDWHRGLAGDRAVVGKSLVLNGNAFTIVGVADASFTRLTPGNVFDVYLPLAASRRLVARWDPSSEDGDAWWLTVVARLR